MVVTVCWGMHAVLPHAIHTPPVLQGVYTPSIIATNNIQVYKTQIGNVSNTMYGSLNTTLLGYREAAYAGELPRLSPDTWAQLNSTIATAGRASRNLVDPKVSQTGTLMPSICSDQCPNMMTSGK